MVEKMFEKISVKEISILNFYLGRYLEEKHS